MERPPRRGRHNSNSGPVNSDSKDQAGMVLNENLEIACGNNSLKILEIQREGKRAQKTNEFILGTKIKKGSDLNNV